MFNKISVIGLGYIGLPTAAIFASRKKNVIGVDVNVSTVETINRGEIHIVEPHLDLVVHAVVTEGLLKATTEPVPSDAFIVAVPTPIDKDNNPNLSFLETAISSIAPCLQKGNLVVIESTVPVGATEKMANLLKELRPDLGFPQDDGDDSDIRIAHCPERVLPGHVVRELVENDRVIGGISPKCSETAVSLYKVFVEGDCIVTSVRTAEMAKLAENSYRDINIAYANELSLLCDEYDIDVWELISLSNRHPRVDILKPGAGVGGHCIAVDPWFLVSKSPDTAKLIRSAREVNNYKPLWVVEKINSAIKTLSIDLNIHKNELKVALLGVTFKPDIDDIRESPALPIINGLSKLLLPKNITIVEPNLVHLPEPYSNYKHQSLDEAIREANVLVVLVAHREFVNVDRLVMKNQKILIFTK